VVSGDVEQVEETLRGGKGFYLKVHNFIVV
jgi:hypothetical protein